MGEHRLREVLEHLAAANENKDPTWLRFLAECVAQNGKLHVDNAAVISRGALGGRGEILQVVKKGEEEEDGEPSEMKKMLDALVEVEGDPELIQKAADQSFTVEYVCRSGLCTQASPQVGYV